MFAFPEPDATPIGLYELRTRHRCILASSFQEFLTSLDALSIITSWAAASCSRRAISAHGAIPVRRMFQQTYQRIDVVKCIVLQWGWKERPGEWSGEIRGLYNRRTIPVRDLRRSLPTEQRSRYNRKATNSLPGKDWQM